ncbi:unnamed protein product [Closterium sp. Naga37s-1]|nr:unnamed protein product [Closterium sp. Naga37s-1]
MTVSIHEYGMSAEYVLLQFSVFQYLLAWGATHGPFGAAEMEAAEMAAAEMMAAGLIVAELNDDVLFCALTVYVEMVDAAVETAERVAAQTVPAKMMVVVSLAAVMVVAEMLPAEKVPAVMVPAALLCDHSSFAAALPSFPFSLFLQHPCGLLTHPPSVVPVHAGWPRVRPGSAAHWPPRPQRDS